jgi:hypothetical protein
MSDAKTVQIILEAVRKGQSEFSRTVKDIDAVTEATQRTVAASANAQAAAKEFAQTVANGHQALAQAAKDIQQVNLSYSGQPNQFLASDPEAFFKQAEAANGVADSAKNVAKSISEAATAQMFSEKATRGATDAQQKHIGTLATLRPGINTVTGAIQLLGGHVFPELSGAIHLSRAAFEAWKTSADTAQAAATRLSIGLGALIAASIATVVSYAKLTDQQNQLAQAQSLEARLKTTRSALQQMADAGQITQEEFRGLSEQLNIVGENSDASKTTFEKWIEKLTGPDSTRKIQEMRNALDSVNGRIRAIGFSLSTPLPTEDILSAVVNRLKGEATTIAALNAPGSGFAGQQFGVQGVLQKSPFGSSGIEAVRQNLQEQLSSVEMLQNALKDKLQSFQVGTRQYIEIKARLDQALSEGFELSGSLNKIDSISAINDQIAALGKRGSISREELADFQRQVAQIRSTSDIDQLLQKLEAIKQKAAELQATRGSQGAFTTGFDFKNALTGTPTAEGFIDSLGNSATRAAELIKGTLGNAINGVSSGITGLITGTQTWGQAMRQTTIAVIGSLVQVGVQYVAQSILRAGIDAAETAGFLGHVTTRATAHATGEVAKTGTSAAGALARGVIHVGETIFHGIQVGIRVVAHTIGEIAKTVATVANTAIRIPAIIAETVASLGEAAVKGASSVADTPYVGPILAIAAMAAIVAAGVKYIGGFKNGGYTGSGGRDEVAGVVHKGEVVIPATEVQRRGVGHFAQYFGANRMPGYAAGGFVQPLPSLIGGTSGPAFSGGGGLTLTLVQVSDRQSERDVAASDMYAQTVRELQKRGNKIKV